MSEPKKAYITLRSFTWDEDVQDAQNQRMAATGYRLVTETVDASNSMLIRTYELVGLWGMATPSPIDPQMEASD